MSGTSVGLTKFFIVSTSTRSWERPPCIVRILSSISAATGKQLKQSVNTFQRRIECLLLHSS